MSVHENELTLSFSKQQVEFKTVDVFAFISQIRQVSNDPRGAYTNGAEARKVQRNTGPTPGSQRLTALKQWSIPTGGSQGQ